MRPQIRFLLGILTAGFIALCTVNPLWGQSTSHARVVRLSFVEGNVTVERPDVQTWAEAPVNTPLQEGFKLSTGENSYAEIQFENGGTIRLGQLGLLKLTELAFTPDGGKINHADLRQGYATFHPLTSHLGESLKVGTPYGTLTARGGTQFRVDLDQGMERVEVIDGEVEVQSNLGDTTIEKDSVLIMQPGAADPTVVSQGITKDDWDQWVEDRENQVTMGSGGPPPEDDSGDDSEATYGMADLSHYGSWSDVPGEGYGWSPTWMGAGWAPYANGQWCWYPVWGYTWIGAEPWGWLPYHYGGWIFIQGRGWVWFPGPRRKWSPGQVTWFHGPGWVGWVPRSPRKDKDNATSCGEHCGGGVVSASTFRQGGRLTSNLMLGINPTAGETVKDPGITPSMAARLPGPAVSLPAAQSQSFHGKPARSPVGANGQATATSSPGSRSPHAAAHNSAIVYDPKQDSYINGYRVTTPQQSPASGTGSSAPTTPGWNPGLVQPGLVQPVPVAGRAPSRQSPETQGSILPNPAGNSFIRQAPAEPRNNLPVGQASGGHPAESHVSSGTPGGGHPSSAPVGGAPAGGHPSPAPASGGGHAGGGGAPSGGHH